jgi:hypothetical protein
MNAQQINGVICGLRSTDMYMLLFLSTHEKLTSFVDLYPEILNRIPDLNSEPCPRDLCYEKEKHFVKLVQTHYAGSDHQKGVLSCLHPYIYRQRVYTECQREAAHG